MPEWGVNIPGTGGSIWAGIYNPYDRFLSIWRGMVLKRNYFKFDKSRYLEMRDLDAFLTFVENQDLSNCDEHIMCQADMIDFENLDFLGRFESFDKDFSYVAKELGLRKFKPKHLNSSPSIETELTPKQKRRIFSLYRKDFEELYPSIPNPFVCKY